MTTCGDCNAEIEWLTLPNGKYHPVDPGYITYEEAKTGDRIVTDGGNIVTKTPLPKMPNIKGRISHFSTCRKGL